ncbi:Uncharacterized protein Fot_09476 [Forsythia ovata]|uniref:Uncharacterized protein n=1 Tax=Forsythia ovata TaxID=205694 RepID=A0ABD1WE45_9LAMI
MRFDKGENEGIEGVRENETELANLKRIQMKVPFSVSPNILPDKKAVVDFVKIALTYGKLTSETYKLEGKGEENKPHKREHISVFQESVEGKRDGPISRKQE